MAYDLTGLPIKVSDIKKIFQDKNNK